MKLEIENLGALSVGKLNLADLTVICGENNTGKTYLTYTLYGLLKTWSTFLKLPDFDLQPLRESGLMEINLANRVIAHAPQILQQAVEDYCVNLYRVLAAQTNRFDGTKLRIELNFKDVLLPEYKREFTTDRRRRIISFTKQADSPILNISAVTTEIGSDSVARFSYKPIIERVIKEICFSPVLPEPFIVSTERTGVVTFQSELNLSRNRLFDLAREVTGANAPEPTRLINDVYGGGYPMPVKDNVDFINTLASVQDQTSKLIEEHPDILNDFETLIGGTYKLQSETLHYIPKGTRGVRLRMGESSSAARSLVILGYYLRHRAKPGDLLMIDEPELNLHPANQRRLARLLARLVNAGIKVFVTTHSDYIIKEFNTLIMLNNADANLEAVRKRYHYTAEDSLAPELVRVYMLREDMALKSGNQRKTKSRTLCEAPISPTLGIEVASFDDTIEEMNAIQEAIYYGLNNGSAFGE